MLSGTIHSMAPLKITTSPQKMENNWSLRDQTRSASAIQFPPPPPTTMVPNRRGLVIVDTRSGLVFEQLVFTHFDNYENKEQFWQVLC